MIRPLPGKVKSLFNVLHKCRNYSNVTRVYFNNNLVPTGANPVGSTSILFKSAGNPAIRTHPFTM